MELDEEGEKMEMTGRVQEDLQVEEPLIHNNVSAKIIKTDNKTKVKMKVGVTSLSVVQERDVCAEVMGDWGWWQARTVFIIYLTKIPAAWYMACIIFTAPEPWYGDYKCDLSEYVNKTDTANSWTRVSHPLKLVANGSYHYDYCSINLEYGHRENSSVFKNYSRNVECEKFVYSIDVFTSLVTQFDLLCSRNILIAITQVFHLLGVLIGGVTATYMMELWSPKVVMMIGMILTQPCGIATGYMPFFWLHVLFRCLVAACCAMAFTPGAVIMSDIVGGRVKLIVSANFEQYWSIGVILLPAIGYYTKNWSQIYVTITLPMILVIILWIWIPDSPRWHLDRENILKVKEILESSLDVNNRQMKNITNLEQTLKEQSFLIQSKKRKLSLQDNWQNLLSLPGALQRIVLSFTCFSLILTCYYGTLLNIRSFGRQYLFVNTAITGLCEVIGCFAGFLILFNTSQKWKIVGTLTMFCGLVTCFIWILPTHVDGSHMLHNLLLISMVNKIGISACLCVITTCTAELFPIPHKKRAVFWSTVSARTVFMTAPLIGATVKYGDSVSLTFFGILTAVAGLCAAVLKPIKMGKNNLPQVISRDKIWVTSESDLSITRL